MSLLKTRDYYKPFDYSWMFEYYDLQNRMHWHPMSVPLHTDVKDWNEKLTDSEKNLLVQIFRLFTQSDVDVASGYVEKYMQLFKLPEARMMMLSFGNMEAIHQHAYSLLLDTVGMPEIEYKAFAEYEEMSDKHAYITDLKAIKSDKRTIAKALAVYSAFTEGLQLFSSFAILMNFQRFGKMKGMCQIVAYSIKDESLHVEAMTKLFREFDRICRKHNLKYWCIGGTLIGVLRHKGWIPFDGDIDVGMTQDDYSKLQKIVQSELPKGMWFQDRTTDKFYKSDIGKIRDINSNYKDYKSRATHNGMQLDIFIFNPDKPNNPTKYHGGGPKKYIEKESSFLE